MVRAEVDGDRLTHDELLVLVGALLVAGTDTTRNRLAAAVHVLVEHPDQWALLAAHPELVAPAVEEIMRFCPVILHTFRTALSHIELAGVHVQSGTLVTANIAAANRDPEVYEYPDRFNVERSPGSKC